MNRLRGNRSLYVTGVRTGTGCVLCLCVHVPSEQFVIDFPPRFCKWESKGK
ncbi:hypothetical protein [Candidatus Liberibacter solanacearum]|uniref:hypothetical protein n=1 Tax=Candidatus Liberibacter solanacearum TaxID=556287 RepID=UPI001377A2BF|nr:hypothetical protein [Candidatus Liberibacter solanacearum]